MQNYSSRHNDNINEDAFDDDPNNINHHFNNSSIDVKLRRTNSSNYPILHRALSTVSANQTLVHNQRNVLAKNYRRTSVNDEIVTIDHNDADASFLLPNLYELPEDIRLRVMDSLVDTPTMVSLEETKRLNWWVNKKLPCPKLYPLVTSGDGNCLLHATSLAPYSIHRWKGLSKFTESEESGNVYLKVDNPISLAMWGFHDHSLSMRKALNETLITSKPNNSLYRRWRWTQSVQNKKYGLVFSEQEWNEEWKSLLRLSSAEPRISQTKTSNLNPSVNEINHSKSSQTITSTNPPDSTKSTRQYYESLEEFHVYVLANNIRRPIIVYSDTILRTKDGEAISPIEFGGIYLPLEIPPDKCHKQPVFLAFDAAHFSALVLMEQNSKLISKVTYRIPLIDIDTLDLLPIHFFIDPGFNFQWPIDEELSDDKIHLFTNYGQSRMNILDKYLNLSKESSPLNNLIPQMATPDDMISTTDSLNNTSSTNMDLSNELNSPVAPIITNKKTSRPSFNSFSKIMRRTFIEPFSSTKRISLKHQNNDTSDSSVINENISERRRSSPLLNRRTNMLTIIVTNFQPKRPKTSDNMIKNYIDACLNEYRLEKNQKQINENSLNENENLQTNKPLASLNGNSTSKNSNHYSDRIDDSSTHHQPAAYHRYNPSSATNRYRQETVSANVVAGTSEKIIETAARRKLPQASSSKTAALTRHIQNNCDIDDNEDFLPAENGQFSTNITYVQRKPIQLTQSNSFEISHDSESHVNDLSNKTSSIINHASQKLLPSSLKRQQSLSSDKNSSQTNQYLIDSNINKRTQQLNSTSNGTSRITNNIQQKRL